MAGFNNSSHTKRNKDFKICKNYRQIALINCLCKILEKIINVRIIWFLESNKIISPYQSGFRKNGSSVDHIIQLQNTVRQKIANKRHKIAVFFDIKKAYDTAWKLYIMKLHQYGMRGHILSFIKNFQANYGRSKCLIFRSSTARGEHSSRKRA